MSEDHVDDETATQPEVTVDDAVEAAPAPPTDPVAEPTAFVPPPVPPPVPTVMYDFERPKRRTWPVLGPALVVSGVSLWAFVVMGTYTTSWLPGGDAPLGAGFAVLLTACATIGALVVTVRRSQTVPSEVGQGSFGRFVSVGLVGFAFWSLAVLLGTFVGRESAANVDLAVAFGLLVVSGAAIFMGDRMLGREVRRKSSTRRIFVLAAWLGIGLLTLGSCVELVAEH